jgi:hypothetical protein
VEDKENRTRPAGKKVVKERKTSSTMTSVYSDDEGTSHMTKLNADDLEAIMPKKVKKQKQSKSDDQPKPKKTKPVKEPTPDISVEYTQDSIQDIEEDTTPDTSLDSILSAPPKKKGRPTKSTTATPQAQPARARSASVQPSASKKSIVPSSTAKSGVKGRKPKSAAIPETQLEMSVVEEEDEDVEEIHIAPRARQGSILPASVSRKSSYEVLLRVHQVNVASREERSNEGITDTGRE